MEPFAIFSQNSILAIVGAGGKTSLMFYLSRALPWNCLLTTTTKVGLGQIQQADACVSFEEFQKNPQGHSELKSIWVSPGLSVAQQKISGFTLEQFSQFAAAAEGLGRVILNEADGAHCRHLKAPNATEPVIPVETTHVLNLVGIDVIGEPLNAENVHRLPEFLAITGGQPGALIDEKMIARAVLHPLGGFKNAPAGSRKILVINQVDSPDRIRRAESLAELVIHDGGKTAVDQVWLTCLDPQRKPGEKKIIKTYGTYEN